MPKRKLELRKQTLVKLTSDELDGAVGGVHGVSDSASNQTSFDTNGAKLSVQWYLQKWTIR
jgi:hypothetical protein